MENGKVKKSLLLFDFVVDDLDREGELYGGPGIVASAAIYHFCHLRKKEKEKVLTDFRVTEIKAAYADEVDQIVSGAEDAAKKQKPGQKPLESA